jgi:hypothetical protein
VPKEVVSGQKADSGSRSVLQIVKNTLSFTSHLAIELLLSYPHVTTRPLGYMTVVRWIVLAEPLAYAYYTLRLLSVLAAAECVRLSIVWQSNHYRTMIWSQHLLCSIH